MAKIKPKTLTCPNCSSPLPVRNVMKAKTVVCRSCDSQIDMSKPELAVMAQLRKQYDSQHGIIPGMKGQLPDGRACEVVGRLRYEDGDIEETWYWDEWLVLAANGKYLWLTEDEGRFRLLTRFDPDFPATLDALQGQWFEMEGVKYRIQERGNPKVVAIQGELTFKATIGDRVHFVDARGNGKQISVEWTDEEVEFFEAARISRREALTIAGLDRLLELDDQLPALKREAGAGARSAGCSGMIAGGGAALAFMGFTVSAVTSYTVEAKNNAILTHEELNTGTKVLDMQLRAGEEYTAYLDIGKFPSEVKHVDVTIDTPLTGSFPLWSIDNPLASGHGRLKGENKSFVADSSGQHTITFKSSGATKNLELVDVSVMAGGYNATALFCLAPFLLVVAVGLFMLSAGRKTAAALWVSKEMRKRRAAIMNELHEAATVQE